jgi:uncharacterized protein (DUF885 family)
MESSGVQRSRESLRLIAAAALVCMLWTTACAPPAGEAPVTVEGLADDYMEAYFERYPEASTFYGIAGRRHDRLTDNSLDALRRWQAREDEWLARLGELGADFPTGSPEWLIHGVLLETLQSSVAMRVCRAELWGVNDAVGWQTDLAYLAEIQPVGTDELRRQALARARALPRYLDTEIENLREGLRLGFSAPRRSVRLVAEQVRGLLEDGSPLCSPARRDPDAEFRAAFSQVFEEEIDPALRRYLEFLEEEYEPGARQAISVAANPAGSDCYRAAVRHHSTVDLPPQEIHDLGLQQMEAIELEMREVARRSFESDDLPALLHRLRTDRRYAFSSREEILDHAQSALTRAREAMPRFFGILPQADVVIEPYPPFREDSGTGEYETPAEDGSRPGIYYIPVSDPESRPRVVSESLTFHETVPGHHLQLTIALERGERSHPVARYLDFSGYSEGWGLYSERLADEMGLYSSDLDRLGMLGDQAARAARLIIDTGIHRFGWSRQQAVDYMLNHTTWASQDIEAEVDRYIVWPGQATSYMLGMLKIRELRRRSEAALGPSFRIRDFHDRILEDGPMTLAMLEEKIERWISESR